MCLSHGAGVSRHLPPVCSCVGVMRRVDFKFRMGSKGLLTLTLTTILSSILQCPRQFPGAGQPLPTTTTFVPLVSETGILFFVYYRNLFFSDNFVFRAFFLFPYFPDFVFPHFGNSTFLIFFHPLNFQNMKNYEKNLVFLGEKMWKLFLLFRTGNRDNYLFSEFGHTKWGGEEALQ